MEQETKRKRKKRTKNHYFTEEVHQKAIIQYNESTDYHERDKLYNEIIGPAFNEMVDKITYTFKFTSLPNIDLLRDECKVWLTTVLDKYQRDQGFKAFSYFSVITKNWFIAQTKKNSKKAQKEILYESLEKAGSTQHSQLIEYCHYEEDLEWQQFLESLWKNMQLWEEELTRTNEQKVLIAVKELFKEAEGIEIFNKKAIYLYLRELTGLNTKQIVNNLNKLRERYKEFKEQWEEEGT